MQYFYKRLVPDKYYYTYVVVTENTSTDNGYVFQCGNSIKHALACLPEHTFMRGNIVFTSLESLRKELRKFSMEYTLESHPELFI